MRSEPARAFSGWTLLSSGGFHPEVEDVLPCPDIVGASTAETEAHLAAHRRACCACSWDIRGRRHSVPAAWGLGPASHTIVLSKCWIVFIEHGGSPGLGSASTASPPPRARLCVLMGCFVSFCTAADLYMAARLWGVDGYLTSTCTDFERLEFGVSF